MGQVTGAGPSPSLPSSIFWEGFCCCSWACPDSSLRALIPNPQRSKGFLLIPCPGPATDSSQHFLGSFPADFVPSTQQFPLPQDAAAVPGGLLWECGNREGLEKHLDTPPVPELISPNRWNCKKSQNRGALSRSHPRELRVLLRAGGIFILASS